MLIAAVLGLTISMIVPYVVALSKAPAATWGTKKRNYLEMAFTAFTMSGYVAQRHKLPER